MGTGTDEEDELDMSIECGVSNGATKVAWALGSRFDGEEEEAAAATSAAELKSAVRAAISCSWPGLVRGPWPKEKKVEGKSLPTAAWKHQPASLSQSSFLKAVYAVNNLNSFAKQTTRTPETPTCSCVRIHVHLIRTELLLCVLGARFLGHAVRRERTRPFADDQVTALLL